MIGFSSLPYSEKAILSKKVFTQAAAARILSDRWNTDLSRLVRKIKICCEWEYVCFVHVPGKRPIFISKMEFIWHFIEFRTNSAMSKDLVVRLDYQYPQNAWIESWKNNGTHKVYNLDLYRDGIECDCQDFSGQHHEPFIPAIRRYIPSFKATCKHILSFLLSINLYSQHGWIENQRWADRWVPQPSLWDEEEWLETA